MAHSLLAFDLALNAGYMWWREGEPRPIAGLLEIDRKLSLGGRLAVVFRFAFQKAKEWGVTDFVIEEPLVGSGVPGKAAEFHWLISAYGVVCMVAAQVKNNGVPINVTPIANATMAVHWLGSRDIEKKLRKTQSVLEAGRRGLDLSKFDPTKSHNVADAGGVLSTRCAQLNLCHLTPWDSKRSPGPLFTGSAAPAGVKITKANKIAANVAVNKLLSFEREKPS